MSSNSTEMPPAVVPYQPSAGAGPDDPIVFATDQAGLPVAWPVAGESPHMLVAGGSGTGVSATVRFIVTEAARRGFTVRLCCPNQAEAATYAGWPNVTVASTAEDMAEIINQTYVDMMARYRDIEGSGAEPEGFPRILFATDDSLATALLISDWWAAQRGDADGQPKVHPSLARFRDLLHLCRGARISILDAGTSAVSRHGDDLDDLDNFGTRLLLGRSTTRATRAVLGADAERPDISLAHPGAGTVSTGGALVRVQVHWLPEADARRAVTAAAV